MTRHFFCPQGDGMGVSSLDTCIFVPSYLAVGGIYDNRRILGRPAALHQSPRPVGENVAVGGNESHKNATQKEAEAAPGKVNARER